MKKDECTLILEILIFLIVIKLMFVFFIVFGYNSRCKRRKMMKRRTAREKALQALYQIDIAKVDVQDAMESVLNDETSDRYFESLVTGIIEHRDQVDELIRGNLENWTLERLANIDRNLLRIAVYEMQYSEDIPVNVAMDEVIEIAKKFGDDQSSSFVNAVLSKIKQHLGK
jgi:transcription antitermination protein NusB